MSRAAGPDDAVEVIEPSASVPFVITCEHGGARLPLPWAWPSEDAWITTTHWAYDLGAADLARELAAHTGAGAVIAGFSRLLVDPNRPLDSDGLCRRRAEGREVALNRDIDAVDREARVAYWRTYHDAVEAMLDRNDAPYVLAIHSFTPLYEGEPRQLELGVLFDRAADEGRRLAEDLAGLSLETRLNEPYSGKLGLIYSAERHAQAHDRVALEIELRQDHAVDPSMRARLVEALAAARW